MEDDALTLFPELDATETPPPRWEVIYRVRRRDGGEPLVPLGVPRESGAMAYWTASKGAAVVRVDAADEREARKAAAEACPGWADLPGVTVTAEQIR